MCVDGISIKIYCFFICSPSLFSFLCRTHCMCVQVGVTSLQGARAYWLVHWEFWILQATKRVEEWVQDSLPKPVASVR